MKRLDISIFLLVTILSGIVYYNSIDNGFHFDDRHHIVNNHYLRTLRNIPLFFVDLETFSTEETYHYRPLVLVSHTINYYFGGKNPAGYHVVNLAFHAGAAYLVYLIVREMLNIGSRLKVEGRRLQVEGKDKKVNLSPMTYDLRPTTSFYLSDFFAPLVAGLIFLVHPFNSEVVNYISARSSVMSSFFYLLAFYFWIRYRKVSANIEEITGREKKIETQLSATCYLLPVTYYIASLLAFLLGMLTKEIAITLPIMLWLYDIYFIPVSSLKEHIKRLKVYIPFIVLVAMPYIVLRSYLIGALVSPNKPARDYFLNLLMETKVLVRYLYLLLFPVDLSVEHAVLEVSSILEWKVIGSIVILIALISIGAYLYRRKTPERRILSFFIPWFFITLLPTTLIPLNAPLQENRGYLAGVGYAVLLGILIHRFASWSRYRKIFRISILISILFLFSVMTVQRNVIWKDDFTLWFDAAQKSPLAWRAHNNLAHAYYKYGLEKFAIEEYRKAIEARGDYYKAMNNLGSIYFKNGQFELALIEFSRAVAVKPTYIRGRMNLAKVLIRLGRIERARKEYELVVRIGKLLKEDDESIEKARKYLRWFKIRGTGKVPVSIIGDDVEFED